MHFNGTAGVWRRATIQDAGGWEHDTLTEDLDLSYRAQLKGWQFVYLPQFCAPAELPPEMIGFKAQAHRWTKGNFQTAIKLLPKILRSKKLPLRIKTEACFHLTNTLVYPLMVALTLLIYPIFYMYSEPLHFEAPLKDHAWGHVIFSVSLFILATCSASTFFIFGQRELFGREAGWKTLLYLPFLMALGVGMGINNAKAVFEAIWGALSRRPSEFIRTPKYGVTGNARKRWTHRSFNPKKLILPALEIGMGTYMIVCIWISWMWDFGRSSIPFLLIFAGGYLYVGLVSLYALWQMHHQTDSEPTLPPEAASAAPL
jgi:cellulose synthase/poly-beta-1,6-N-acetylglucosamine synthase-like glycosyltransferase